MKNKRSGQWFQSPGYYGFSRRAWLRSEGFPADVFEGKPVVGICNSWSELNNCNAHLREVAAAVKRGVLAAGGVPLEFPTISLGEMFMAPTTMMFRNLMAMDVEESIRANPMDAVVLLCGCDKTTPAQLMGAASADIPAIVVPGGPMLAGQWRGQRLGSGTDGRKLFDQFRTGRITEEEWCEIEGCIARTTGHCTVMGTASTMTSLAEALGMTLPGCANIPAPDSRRLAIAELSGRAAVELIEAELTPSRIMTREAFENVIVVNSAIGGSTNAPIHFHAIASHIGVQLDNDDWEKIGYDIPLLVNLQPAGEYLGEEYHRAGGVPAVIGELIRAGRIRKNTLTVNGKTLYENCKNARIEDEKVIWSYNKPMKEKAGFLNLKGNLFDSAIMTTSVISDAFRKRYLSNPNDPNAFEGRAIVFDGPEDYHHRIDDPKLEIDDTCMLFVRGTGPVGYPGAAEVVNMQPPAELIKHGVTELPCIGDGRQSGTSGSPSILNASPEAATGGGLAILKTGDRIRIDLNKRTANILISKAEYDRRKKALAKQGGFKIPGSQTPWQEIQRGMVDELSHGMVLKPAVKYQRISTSKGTPRDNH